MAQSSVEENSFGDSAIWLRDKLGKITVATGDGGFKGLGGRYSRRNLLHFGVAGIAGMAFTRLDNNAAVDSSYCWDG